MSQNGETYKGHHRIGVKNPRWRRGATFGRVQRSSKVGDQKKAFSHFHLSLRQILKEIRQFRARIAKMGAIGRSPRGGLIPKNRLRERFAQFADGRWLTLIQASREVCKAASLSKCRRSRTRSDTIERRVEAAIVAGHLSEVARISQLMSSAAQEWQRIFQEQPSAMPSAVANMVR